MNVAILGASPKSDRYANMAQKRLMQAGYRVIPVSPFYTEVLGVPSLAAINQIEPPLDTLTLYLSAEKLAPLADDIIRLHPRRVIFNPGTESSDIETRLQQAGIKTEQACTLVLLSTGQFET